MLRSRRWKPHTVPPWIGAVIILLMILVTEYLLMLVLPVVLPADVPRILEAAVDAVLLTIIVSPVLWWWVVRPLRQAAEQRDHFLSDLFQALEAERRRIAHELHDGVGQSLTLLVSGLRSLPERTRTDEITTRCQELRQLAQRALKDTKTLALGMRPSLLDDLGLAAAIERIVVDVHQNHPLQIEVDVAPLAGRRLAEPVETTLFRICQEALNNVLKHSEATRAQVRLRLEAPDVVLEVTDNGRGFQVEPLTGRRTTDGHLGLIGMQERVALQGGEIQIESAPGRGTALLARIPEQGINP